jgi:hypothetical protein
MDLDSELCDRDPDTELFGRGLDPEFFYIRIHKSSSFSILELLLYQ